MDVFDLIQAPARIRPAFAFDALFLAIGPSLLALAIFILRHTKRGANDLGDRARNTGWFLIPFSTIWIGFTCWMCGDDISHAYVVRSEVQQGRYATIEGCLEGFHAGVVNPGKSTAGNERWSVGGRQFSYGDNEIRFAYHEVEPGGGGVHADSWVQVSYVPDQFLGRDDIVRLRVRPHACPSAGDLP